jgi:hypothetical protein
MRLVATQAAVSPDRSNRSGWGQGRHVQSVPARGAFLLKGVSADSSAKSSRYRFLFVRAITFVRGSAVVRFGCNASLDQDTGPAWNQGVPTVLSFPSISVSR